MGAVLAVPLFPETEWIQSLGPVDGEHSIQMIDFVLEELGTISFYFNFSPVAFHVLVADSDSVCPRNSDQQVGE